jgi:ATP-GRASP peptide maturase of grasp-with-spasm system
MAKDLIVIGSEDWDTTTEVVMWWLKYYREKVVRINMEDLVQLKSVVIGEKGIDLRMHTKQYGAINLSDVKSFWLRRSEVVFQRANIAFGRQYELAETEKFFNRHLDKEIKTVETFLEHILLESNDIKTLGVNANYSTNKLINLSVARSVGLQIPETAILTDKQALADFIHNNDGTITKTISDMNPFQYEIEGKEYRYALYTNTFSDSQLPQLGERFFPTLFQEQVNKRVELRIFYLAGKCFSMAIFSQQDEKTQVDFRRYNYIMPNRTAPFKLPAVIEKKIVAFMERIKLNCGSIDMIYTESGEFVFLEVNPFGQFGMVSYPCNYYIEKQIAEYLR